MKNFLLLLRGSAVVIALLIILGAIRTSSFFTNMTHSIFGFFQVSETDPEVDPRTLVVHQVQGVSELTTAVFAMESVVPASRDRTLGNYVIGKTTLLYIAYGEVRAGVDLSDIGEEDVSIEGDRLELRLPPPEILDSKIDVTRSRVYDYDRGFLGLGPDSAPELQEMAQRETLTRIIDVACDNGLLNDANDRAEVALTRLLDSVGYDELDIQTQPAETEACNTAIASISQ
jgi:hypothetical protein